MRSSAWPRSARRAPSSTVRSPKSARGGARSGHRGDHPGAAAAQAAARTGSARIPPGGRGLDPCARLGVDVGTIVQGPDTVPIESCNSFASWRIPPMHFLPRAPFSAASAQLGPPGGARNAGKAADNVSASPARPPWGIHAFFTSARVASARRSRRPNGGCGFLALAGHSEQENDGNHRRSNVFGPSDPARGRRRHRRKCVGGGAGAARADRREDRPDPPPRRARTFPPARRTSPSSSPSTSATLARIRSRALAASAADCWASRARPRLRRRTGARAACYQVPAEPGGPAHPAPGGAGPARIGRRRRGARFATCRASPVPISTPMPPTAGPRCSCPMRGRTPISSSGKSTSCGRSCTTRSPRASPGAWRASAAFATAQRITRGIDRTSSAIDVLGTWLMPGFRGPLHGGHAPAGWRAPFPRGGPFLAGVARLGHGLVPGSTPSTPGATSSGCAPSCGRPGPDGRTRCR